MVHVTFFLGGGFKDFLFLLLPQEMIQFDSYFLIGLKPPPEPRKKPPSYFPLNPGWLIGILIYWFMK